MLVLTLILFLLGSFIWSVIQATQIAIVQLRQMHRVPCDRCAYFTHSYHLKCTVRPCQALTEYAIGCPDFEPSFRSQRPSFWKRYGQPLVKTLRDNLTV